MINCCVICGADIPESGHICTKCRTKLMKSVCSNKCKTCKFAMRTGAGYHDWMCGYCVQTEHSRNCPAGENCTKYEKRIDV